MTVRTRTKAPAPKAKLANPRNEALARMSKPELIKTVKTLDARVTKLLNEILAKDILLNKQSQQLAGTVGMVAVIYPWEQ